MPPVDSALRILTPRGSYLLSLAGLPEVSGDTIALLVKLQHAGGLESFMFRCVIDKELVALDQIRQPERLLGPLSSWLEGHFEQTRESALKSARIERKAFELIFNHGHGGPFSC
jgi:hypothetical protein